jgi:CheY-like chemotaxis protein
MNPDSGVEKIHKLVPLCYMVISKTCGIFVFLRLSAGGPELANLNCIMEASIALIEGIHSFQEGAIMSQPTTRGKQSGQSCTILVVDDDEAMRKLLADALTEHGCRVIESESGNDALNVLKAVVPNVIVTDLKMPGGGFPYLRQLQAGSPLCPIVVMTAYGDSQSKAKALECGVQGYFDKPLSMHDLKAWVSQMCCLSPCGNMPLL